MHHLGCRCIYVQLLYKILGLCGRMWFAAASWVKKGWRAGSCNFRRDRQLQISDREDSGA